SLGPEVDWLVPGTKGATSTFDQFIQERLGNYADGSNNPNNEHACSDMAPYFNRGQFSAQRAVQSVRASKRHSDGVKAFIEQAVIRRELSDNLCFYNGKTDHYDDLSGAAAWARASLDLHSTDVREWTYTLTQLESAQTHDDLWNAAQLQMVSEGEN
ncbi:unnamed protein product, partial [Discosporangium mesarthrocarpum]